MTSPPPAAELQSRFHWNLYILMGGVLLGMLAGPGVLGRFAPQTYDAWFPDWRVAQAKLLAFEREQGGIMQRLAETGASEAALLEVEQIQAAAERQERLDELARGRHRLSILHALVAAVFGIAILEALTHPGTTTHSRLASGRYGLLAVWVAMILAQPHFLAEVPVGFTVVLVAVVLFASLVPLSGKQSAKA